MRWSPSLHDCHCGLQVACEKCGAQRAVVRHRISQLPRILMLHLKRFEMGPKGVRKRVDLVRPDLKLSLGFCVGSQVKRPPTLDLCLSPIEMTSKRLASNPASSSNSSVKQARRALCFSKEASSPPRRLFESESPLGRIEGGSFVDGKAIERSDAQTEVIRKQECRYWQQGFCRNGQSCNFSHELKQSLHLTQVISLKWIPFCPEEGRPL